MVSICDIGSMPPKIPHNELREGARHLQSLAQYTRYGKGYESARKFEENVTSGLIDKLRAGVDVPSYPQFRDMNEMFLDLIDGHTYTPKGYIATDQLTCRSGTMIPEVRAIRNNLKEITEKTGVGEINLKICVTGPYTLSTLFSSRTPELIRDLGKALKDLTANSLFARAAKLSGVPVLVVDPRDTSRRCSECGHTEKLNRVSQSVFKCRSCGHGENADLNAARNIQWRAEVNQPL
ncbi:MAG: zinc ribbon domain-containing protein [Candidatus Bathyarchaeota archaeon]|nr:zinc ribbon domain-containing protein [Candidatus Bathyarchaeota archaeon]